MYFVNRMSRLPWALALLVAWIVKNRAPLLPRTLTSERGDIYIYVVIISNAIPGPTLPDSTSNVVRTIYTIIAAKPQIITICWRRFIFMEDESMKKRLLKLQKKLKPHSFTFSDDNFVPKVVFVVFTSLIFYKYFNFILLIYNI